MILPNNLRYLFKTISALVAGIFLWQQLAWAGDLPAMINPQEVSTAQATPQTLASNQNAVQAFVDMKNSIEDATIDTSNLTTLPIYTYYASGRLATRTLSAPDKEGNIFYQYRDENWNGQGYGRVQKSSREKALNGELSHEYIYYGEEYYYQDASGITYVEDGSGIIGSLIGCLTRVKAYSDKNWTNLLATYSYYLDGANRLESVLLETPDSSGNIYYHYINEDWNRGRRGRLDRSKRQAALNGEMSHTYIYYDQEYYYEDGSGMVYSADSSGISRYSVAYLGKINAYSDSNWQNPIAVYSYSSESGSIPKLLTYGTGETYEYDTAGRITKRTFSNGDYIVITYWNATDLKKYQEAYFKADGTWKYTYQHFGNKPSVQYVWLADKDTSVSGNVIYKEYELSGRIRWIGYDTGEFVCTEYYVSGNKKRVIYFASGGAWLKTVEYYNTPYAIKHFEWMADLNPSVSGDPTFIEYYFNGALHIEELDGYNVHAIDYYDTGVKFRDMYFYKDAAGDWVWLNSMEYYTDGVTKHFEWIADYDPAVNDITTFIEYDTLGRLIREQFDDNTFYGISYYGDTANKYQQWFHDSNWVWLYSVEYYEGTTTIHHKWIADYDTSVNNVIVYEEYDTLGRVILTKLDDTNWVGTSYYGDTANKYQQWFHDSNWVWLYSVEYYEGTTTIHHKWIADYDTSVNNVIVYEEHDEAGALLRRHYDSGEQYEYYHNGDITKHTFPGGNFVIFDYFESGNRSYEAYFEGDWTWINTIRYYDDTSLTKYCEWIADYDPAFNNTETYIEYDTLSRIVRRQFDDGSCITIEYVGDTDVKFKDRFFNPQNAWQRTIEYLPDGKKRHEYILNGLEGDVTYRGYDNEERIIKISFNSGAYYTYEYYEGSLYKERYFDSTNTWQRTIQYWDDGITMRYQYILDADTGTIGDIVYEEYDNLGRQIKRRLDDNAYITTEYVGDTDKKYTEMSFDSAAVLIYTHTYNYSPSGVLTSSVKVYSDGRTEWFDADGNLLGGNFTLEYPAEGYAVGHNGDGDIATFKEYNGAYRLNTILGADGSFTTYNYDEAGALNGCTIERTDGTIEKYDANNRLVEKMVPDSGFIKGVNLPWVNYGYDLGGRFSNDISSNLNALYSSFDKWQGSYVRLFLFCDLRSGINFDASGNPVSFDSKVFGNMQDILDAAKVFNIKLIPVLFDYMIADNVNNPYCGEHPDLLTDVNKKAKLLELFSTFFDEFAGDPSVYAWDIMNEPEFAKNVSISQAQSFVTDFSNLIHSKSQQAKVTLGSARRDYINKYWMNSGLDIYQYHYYDGMESITPVDTAALDLGLDKPVIAGELEPTSITSKLDILNTNGYAGGLFWQDQSNFVMPDSDRVEIRGYFSGRKAIYSHYASGRIKNEIWDDGLIREFEDMAVCDDGNGRLVKETRPDGAYKIYEYYDDSANIKFIRFYTSDNRILIKNEYSVDGKLFSNEEYYSNGVIREKINADGTYQKFDESGNVIESAVKELDVIFVKDGDNNLLREILSDGTIKEYADSKLIRILRPDFTATEYYYDTNGLESLRYEYSANGGITVFDNAGTAVYTYIYGATEEGGDNALSVTTADGDIVKYEGDNIISIERKSDGSVITGIELDQNGNLKNARVKNKDGSVNIIYENSIIETVFPDGTVAMYRGGRLVCMHSELTGYTRYYYTEDTPGDIAYITTVNAKAVCIYDESGLPVRFKKANGEITEYENGHLKRIVDSIGNEYLYNFTGGDNPYSELITVADKDASVPSKIFYTGTGNDILKVMLIDGTVLNYGDGALKNIIGLDDNIVVTEGNKLIFDDGEYEKYYDAKGDLEKIITEDGTTIFFSNGEISEVLADDGTKILYAGGKIADLYDRREGAHYESDASGRVIKVTYDSGTVLNYSYETLTDEVLKVTIVKEGEGADTIVRFYEGDLLTEQYLPSGVVSKYEYEPDGEKRILKVIQTKNGVEIGRYDYVYSGMNTLVTDIKGEVREYDTAGNIKFRYTPEGYVYEYYETDHGTLVSELARWNKEDGKVIYYKSGEIDRVETTAADGSVTVLKDALFDSAGKLKSFTVILPTGESRRCTVYNDGWSEIVTADAKLIYKDDGSTGNGRLIAVNSNHKLFMFDESVQIPSYITVDIMNDPGAIDHIYATDGALTEYDRQMLLKEYNIIKDEIVDKTVVSGSTMWKAPTPSEAPYTQGLSINTASGQTIIANAAINGANSYKYQGEAFVDLRYYAGWGANGTLYDLNGMKLSFYVKLENGKLPEGGKLNLQAFAKSVTGGSWLTEYSTEITMTEDGAWYRVDLNISDEKPMFGLMDQGFDPTHISAVGIRLASPDTTCVYNGLIYIKDANYQTPPAGEKIIDFPFLVNKNSVTPYIGAIPDDQPVQGNPNYISWADIPTRFLNPEGASENGQINLDVGIWRAQDYIYSTGIESVVRDDANNRWGLGLNLKAGDESKNDGEMYIDLRYDIPGHTWDGPLDLTGKELTFKVKAPEGFLDASGSRENPMWAQVFVKDEAYNFQYGRNVKIQREGEWITVTLVPQVGEIEEGNSCTSPDFDPTKIINIGVKISCNAGSVSEYQGDFYVQNATSPDILNQTQGVYLIDINALKDYAVTNNINLTFEENLGPQIKLAKQSLPSYFKDDSYAMATEYYPDGSIKSVLKGNARVEYYNTSGKLIKITDKDDAALVEYKYDTNGDLIEVDYSGTRDSIKKEMDDARAEAKRQADATIMKVAEAKGYADAYVDSMIKPALKDAYRLLGSLQAMWNEWNGKKTGWFGDCSREEKKAMMRGIESNIGQVQRAISNLLAEAARLYAGINTDINNAKNAIENELNESLDLIDEQEEEALINSLEQEAIEVIEVYYEKILGRNATVSEIDSWLAIGHTNGCFDLSNRVAFDFSLIKTELATNEEYVNERAANDLFIQHVNDALSAYLAEFKNMTDEEKTSVLSGLGLEDGDISYSGSDFESIIKWLDANNKHFGKSAFLALKEILTNNGCVCDLEDLAKTLILIDIFTGSITSLTSGELEISIYAISKYASLQGVVLYNAELDRSDLDALRYVIEDGKKVIVRVGANHFIVVTSVAEDGTVAYLEPSNGSSGEVMTMAGEDFLKQWDGFAVTERAPPADNISRILTSAEAMLIRGSEASILVVIFSIISIACSIIGTILSFIDNEVCQLIGRIFDIIALVTGVLAIALDFGNIIKSFAKGLQGIGESIKANVVRFGEMFTNGIKGFTSGIQAIASGLAKSIVNVSLSMSYNRALTSFGLNSDIAGLTSAFLSGGFTGINNTFSLSQAFSSFTIEGVRYAGRELGIDPTITGIIGISAGTIVSAGLGGVSYYDVGSDSTKYLHGLDAISYSIKTTVLPNVASEFAYYGITKLGEAIGIDPIISQLAGIGIRSTISAALRNRDVNNIFQSVMSGLLQGVTSIGLNYVTQELGLNPLLANIGFSAIASAINAGIQVATGQGGDFFGIMFDTYKNNACTFLGYNLTPDINDFKNADGSINGAAYKAAWDNYYWLETSYKSSIIDFSDIVRTKGLADALNIYGTSFFNSTTVGAIAQSGMTIGKYFIDKINAGNYTSHSTSGGISYIDVPIIDENNNVIGHAFFRQVTNSDGTTSWILSGKEEGGFWGLGVLGKDPYGNLNFWNDGEFVSTFDSYTQIQHIHNGQQTYAEIKDSQGNTLLIIEPTISGGYNIYNSYGEYVDAIVTNSDRDFYFNLGKPDEESKETLHFEDLEMLLIPEEDITAGDLEGVEIVITKDENGNFIRKLNGKVEEVILENGEKGYKFLGKIFTMSPNMYSLMTEHAERVSNNMYGLAMRTDIEVYQHKIDTLNKTLSLGQPGYMIAGVGNKSPGGMVLASIIKMGETTGAGDQWPPTSEFFLNPTSYLLTHLGSTGLAGYDRIVPDHVGMIIIENGEKKVLEISAFGQRIVTLEEFSSRYHDIVVVKPNGGGEAAANYLINTYFQENQITHQLEPKSNEMLSYNFVGLFGFGNRISGYTSSFICSELYYHGFKKANWDGKTVPLPGVVEDRQISPYDLIKTIPQWGEDILNIQPEN